VKEKSVMKKLVKVLSIAAVAAAALLAAQPAQAWWAGPGIGPAWGGPWGGYGPYGVDPLAVGAYGPGSNRYQRCLAREVRGAWWGELPHPPGYCEKYRYGPYAAW
jgi:hypothetical protein